ncbi:hypothetical protein BY458DRAFT_523556 [Sporodiniella umbellata]|nr:hypothetical protein BY458DRAFT_523556 [Sporodiniella umbellata]
MVTLPNNNNSQSQEPHAFDLTWKNYLPSVSQFYCCLRPPIRLEDDEDTLIEPLYYNDLRREAFDTNWEFEPVLGQINSKPSNGKKKSKKRRHHRPEAIMEIEDDAEFVAEGQIAYLAHSQHSKNTQRYEQACYKRMPVPIVEDVSNEPFASETYSNQDSADTPNHFVNNCGSSKNKDKKKRSKKTNLDTQTESIGYQIHDEFSIPSLTDNAPFVSDQHPFTYFQDSHTQSEQEDSRF